MLLVSMLVLAIFFSMGSRVLFSPLMPLLQEELNFNLTTAGTLFLLVSISYAVSMMFAGFLSAKVGHGNTITIALAAMGTGLLLAAVAMNALMLALSLVMIGCAAGLYPPSGLMMINTKIDPAHRSKALSLHELGPNTALLTAPLIVIALEPWVGWRGVLVVMAVIVAVATTVFKKWGAPDSGVGTAPNFSTIGTILKNRSTILGMMLLTSIIASQQGVYAILPAYLVTEHGMDKSFVNLMLSLSRITGILLLLKAGSVIHRIGRRRTMTITLTFSAVFTALLGLIHGPMIAVVIILQPAILTVCFPALLSAMADIGEARYQNITYSLIITAGFGTGSGVVPALLGVFGDMGIGWAGFVLLAAFMLISLTFMLVTPVFGKDAKQR